MTIKFGILRAPEPGDGGSGHVAISDDAPLEEFLNQAVPLGTKFGESQDEPGDAAAAAPDPNAASAAADGQANEDTTLETEQQQAEETADPEAGNEEVPLGVQKRIDKLTRRVGDKDRELEQLRAEVSELRTRSTAAAAPARTASNNPLAHLIQKPGDINDAKLQMRTILEWCEDNAEGGQREGKEYGAEDVKKLRRAAQAGLDVHIPARAEELQQEQAVTVRRNQIAESFKTEYPEFYDRETDIGRAADAWRNDPRLAAMPERDIAASALAIGMSYILRRQAAKKAGKTGAAATARPATTAGGVRRGLPPKAGASTAARGNGKGMLAKADAAFAKSGGSRQGFAEALEMMGPPGTTPYARPK